MHLLKYRWRRLPHNAWRNRQKLVALRLANSASDSVSSTLLGMIR